MCEFQFGISAAVLESNGNLKGPLPNYCTGHRAPQHHAAAEQRVRLLYLYTYFIVLVSLLHVLLEQRC
jgi:hypothetical protein